MKVLVGAFNQEKTIEVAFSMIVKTGCGTDGSICGTTSFSHNICRPPPSAWRLRLPSPVIFGLQRRGREFNCKTVDSAWTDEVILNIHNTNLILDFGIEQ